MTTLSLSAQSCPNFYNLALFICHLFIDGHFRHGHILYDPTEFDDQLITAIESVCPVQIPWLTTDISQSDLVTPRENDRTDHILQLIFFNPKYLAEQIEEYKEYLTFYRIFAFSSVSDGDLKPQISIIENLNPIIASSPLILQYNSRNGLAYVHWASETVCAFEDLEQYSYSDSKVIHEGNKELSVENVRAFDRTFGRYEQKRPVGLAVTAPFLKMEDYGNYKLIIPNLGLTYVANYFFSTLNASYINMTFVVNSDSTVPKVNQILKLEHRHFYNELLLEYQSIKTEKIETLQEQHPVAVHFSATQLQPGGGKGTMTYPLYPYRSRKLAAIFVYGADFERQMNILSIPGSVQGLAISIVLFIISAAIVLCIIRRKFKLRRDGLISTFIDTMVAFIAGGNLRMQHKYERWFFGILLIAAFFITSIFTGDLLEYVHRILSQEIDTFDQLKNRNQSVYIIPSLSIYAKHICVMLRRKIGPNINYKGLDKVPQHEGSFIYVFEKFRIDNVQHVLTENNRDFDVLRESLGDMNTGFHLHSDHYVPDRTLKQIDKASSSFVEHGFSHFYTSFTAFKRQLFYRVNYSQMDEDDDEKALTMEQLRRPMILVFYLWGVTTAIFVAEIIIFKWANWRNRNQYTN